MRKYRSKYPTKLKKIRRLVRKKKIKLKKYKSAYPSKLKGIPRPKDPYSAAHLHWVHHASDFSHRDARTQMTASIVASRMAEEHDPDLKWKRVTDRHYGTTEYHSHDGKFQIKKTGYHPTMGYAHRIKNGAWWTLHKRDEKLGVEPHFMVRHNSHRSLAQAKKSASEWSHRMKTFKESVDNTEDQHLYHVTHTHHVESIKKHGLNPMGGPSNWVKAGTGERYGKGEIYTFTHHEDAKRWAMNMDWAHHQTMGSGKISIIKMKHPKDHPFEEDKNDPLEVMTRKGPALKSMKRIDQKHIVGVKKFDTAALKEDFEIDEELVEAINDWTGEWFPTYESTESALNSQWIQRQNIRRNPKEKKEKIEEQDVRSPGAATLAQKHGVSPDYIARQIAIGAEIETEHTKDIRKARQIARDHIAEFPDYYERLQKMEKKAKKDMKEWDEIPISHPEDSRMSGVNEQATHVIMSRSENGFWSNKHGWVYHKADATKFHPKEFEGKNKLRMPMSSGKDARLLHKDFVPQEFDESVNEMASMSVGSGNVAGMPDADPPDLTPVGLGGKWKSKRKKKFAGRTVFTVDPGTYWKAYLGKRKYEHYEKYLEGCDIAEEIRQYGRKYWDEPIILQNEQTGAMIYLKYGSK